MLKGIVLALLMTMPVWSGDFTGYLKNYSFVADPAPGTVPVEHPASSSTRFRLQYQTNWGQSWSFEVAGESAWTVQQSALSGTSLFMTASDSVIESATRTTAFFRQILVTIPIWWEPSTLTV
ncbi:MAG: hypothetical protein CO090_08355 [Acidobacteria bacterium CG_4_9_14_3_um_filter_49_7]|nr:MAG: hypothetical protein CO090_08355 [Acidobacteria bacterium CG_4_9_14_3_um_filter_49_7]